MAALSESFQDELLRLTNASRAEHGLRPLKPSTGLHKAARWHANWMARHQILSHDEGEVPWWHHVYKYVAESSTHVIDENVGDGFPTAAAVHAAFMRSPEHRDNILNRRNRRFGAASARGGGKTWVSADFSG